MPNHPVSNRKSSANIANRQGASDATENITKILNRAVLDDGPNYEHNELSKTVVSARNNTVKPRQPLGLRSHNTLLYASSSPPENKPRFGNPKKQPTTATNNEASPPEITTNEATTPNPAIYQSTTPAGSPTKPADPRKVSAPSTVTTTTTTTNQSLDSPNDNSNHPTVQTPSPLHNRIATLTALTTRQRTRLAAQARATRRHLRALTALKRSNAALRASLARARTCEDENVATFETLKAYAAEQVTRADEAEKLVDRVHALGEAEWARAERAERGLREAGRREGEWRGAVEGVWEAGEREWERAEGWKGRYERLVGRCRAEGLDGGAAVRVVEGVVGRISGVLGELVEGMREGGGRGGGEREEVVDEVLDLGGTDEGVQERRGRALSCERGKVARRAEVLKVLGTEVTEEQVERVLEWVGERADGAASRKTTR